MKENVHGGDIYSNGALEGKEILDYSSNINPLGVPKSFRENIEEAIEASMKYPDIKYRELTYIIGEYLSKSKFIYGREEENTLKEDVFFREENIVLGNGAAELIDISISLLESLVIAVPSFAEYEMDGEKHGVKMVYSYLNSNMELNYEDFLEKIKHCSGGVLGNPNNPNGFILNKEKLMNTIEFCEKENKILILDEAFIEFTGDYKYSFLEECKKYKCLFIIRALTKFFGMPGIRVGFGVSKNVDFIKKIKERQNPWNINCFGEIAAKYCLRDINYINNSLKWIKEERKFMIENLKEVSFIEEVYLTYTNFVLCKLKGIKGKELYEKCLEKGVLIRRCKNFNGLDDSFVRFAIKDREKNLKFINILNEVK